MPQLVGDLPPSVRSIHIMGIGGTAMAALAGMLKDAGYTVTGSDTGVYPPMSDYLASLGIAVMIGYKAENLAHRPDLVVVFPWVPATTMLLRLDRKEAPKSWGNEHQSRSEAMRASASA